MRAASKQPTACASTPTPLSVLLLPVLHTLACTRHIQVLRGGKEFEYDIALDPLQTLVPVHKYDQLPSYFIYAGG